MSTDGEELHEEDLSLPDNIIGIGNAGKTTVKHYLSQDWIIEEAVAVKDSQTLTDGDNREFNAFMIDTATDEQPADERQVKSINDRIERIAERSGRTPSTVNTGLEYINPLDDAPDNLISRAGLTSEVTVNQIATQDRLKSWWLENEDSMLTDGYGQGVLRRRGLSKALFHASRAGNGDMEGLPRRLSGKTATIVVGLGGGTGSGMYLDLAKLIEPKVDELHLVASIPGLQEKDRRTANTFAALSELEYLALNEEEENPFTNIILVPFGPARNLQNREFFLDAMVQTIVAREATTNDFTTFLDSDNSERIPKAYAPFTVAVPQILRYDVGDIREAKRAITEYREAKREALDAELALYDELHDFFTEEWGGEIADALETAQDGLTVDNDRFALSGDEASSLRNRLDSLQSWIEDEDTFGHVDNEALSDWRAQLGDWIEALRENYADLSGGELKKRLVTRLPDRVDRLEPVDDKYPSEPDDQALAGVFRDELRAIKLRANLLRALKIVDEEEVSEALTAALHPARQGWIGAQRLEDRINGLNREAEQHEVNLELLDDLESDLVAARDHNLESWRETVADDLELLVGLQSSADDIEAQLDALRNELEDTLRTISQANSPDNVPAGGLNFNFDRLNAQLRDVGLDPIDGRTLVETVEQTQRAYEAWYDINNTGLVGNILGSKEDKKEDYVGYLEAVDGDYVDISPKVERGDFTEDFDCRLAADGLFEDITQELAEKRETHRRRVIREFKSTLSEFGADDVVQDYRAQWGSNDFDLEWPGDTGDAVSSMRDRLTDLDADSAQAVFDELLADGNGFDDPGLVYLAVHDAYLGPVEAKRSELNARIEDVESRADVYDSLRRIVMDYDYEYGSEDDEEEFGPDNPEIDDSTNVTGGSENPYVKKIQSEDQVSLLQYNDIADSDIWTRGNSTEMRKIQSHFKDFAETAVQNDELGCLRKRKIEVDTRASDEYTDADNTIYDGHYIGNVFLSRAFDDEENPGHPVFNTVREEFNGSELYFLEDANGYSHESVGYGAPWDLSMVTFVGGVFLDNIRQVNQPTRGYKVSYESQRDDLREAVRIRHVHGVDGRDGTIGGPGEGGYVYRKGLLDVTEPADVYTLLSSDEGEMIETLQEDYIGRTTFPSSIDLDTDT